MILKNKLKDILTEKGISIKEIADFTAIRYATLQRVVSTEYLDTTSFVMLVRIAEYLNVDLRSTFEFDGILKGKGGRSMLEIEKYMREGKELSEKYMKEKEWSYQNFRKNMDHKIKEIQRTLKIENKEDFIHEVILLHSEVGGNMIETGKLISSENWIENGYAFLTGFYGTI